MQDKSLGMELAGEAQCFVPKHRVLPYLFGTQSLAARQRVFKLIVVIRMSLSTVNFCTSNTVFLLQHIEFSKY